MKTLIKKLNNYTSAYDEGRPLISDAEWDRMYFELKKMEEETGIIYPDSPTQIIAFKTVNKLAKVEHNHPMLSCDKTKDMEDILAFVNKYTNVLVMPKLDGLTCSLLYENGKLVSAETRGNGSVGEDITHCIEVMSSVPKQIPYLNKLIVDGEVICKYDDFESFSKEYKNPRNFAAGSIRLLDARESAQRKLTFVAWYVVEGFAEVDSLATKLHNLNSLGFTVVPTATAPMDLETLSKSADSIVSSAKFLNYPIDGLVYRINNVAFGNNLGATDHHRKDMLAFKFYDETYSTKLIDIEWTMGRTGVLTCVAIFEPVEIDGTLIERANMFNISVMEELLHGRGWKGQALEIFKANQIVPQIASAENDDITTKEYFDIPDICPICGGRTGVETTQTTKLLLCLNEACPGKLVNRLDHFCGKKGLDIKGLSFATLNNLTKWGWVEKFSDLYHLSKYRAEWIGKAGFGEKSVNNILEAIEESRNVDLCSFIAAIGIPMVGKTVSKLLTKYVTSYNDFRNKIKNNWDFAQIDGIGPEKSYAILNFDYTEADEVFAELTEKAGTCANEETILDGKIFVITGSLTQFKNRTELKDKIESLGGKVAGSISSKTSYLITNNPDSGSAKAKTAKSLSIPILTEEEFIQKFC